MKEITIIHFFHKYHHGTPMKLAVVTENKKIKKVYQKVLMSP